VTEAGELVDALLVDPPDVDPLDALDAEPVVDPDPFALVDSLVLVADWLVDADSAGSSPAATWP
jgi:hypothetical protein